MTTHRLTRRARSIVAWTLGFAGATAAAALNQADVVWGVAGILAGMALLGLAWGASTWSRAFTLWTHAWIPEERYTEPQWVERTERHEGVHAGQYQGRVPRWLWYLATGATDRRSYVLRALTWMARAVCIAWACARFLGTYFATPRGRLRLEAPAFAESVRVYREQYPGVRQTDAVAFYAGVLHRGYALWGITEAECREAIERELTREKPRA